MYWTSVHFTNQNHIINQYYMQSYAKLCDISQTLQKSPWLAHMYRLNSTGFFIDGGCCRSHDVSVYVCLSICLSFHARLWLFWQLAHVFPPDYSRSDLVATIRLHFFPLESKSEFLVYLTIGNFSLAPRAIPISDGIFLPCWIEPRLKLYAWREAYDYW